MNIPNKEGYLTAREHTLLKSIIQNQYAVGPFSGMIYNEYMRKEGANSIKKLVKEALRVRIAMEELVNENR